VLKTEGMEVGNRYLDKVVSLRSHNTVELIVPQDMQTKKINE
jgi:hypothetical protein